MHLFYFIFISYLTLTVTDLSRNAQWSQWTDTSSCSATCGTGYKTRQRKCQDPLIGAYSVYGCAGEDEGNDGDVTKCHLTYCKLLGMSSVKI